MAEIAVPERLREANADGSRGDWLHRLPGIVDQASERWELEVAEPYRPGGSAAWVAPVRRASGEPAVLKIGWPHPESEHEADGLRHWDGDGAVRLFDAAVIDAAPVLVLERCVPGASLGEAATPEERDVIVADLLRRLWERPPERAGFRTLESMCGEWADSVELLLSTAERVDIGLVRDGLAMFRALPADATEQVVLFTDLHPGNVLRAERERWLAIDPKPYIGDPAYDVLQHLLNVDRLVDDPRGLARRMADLTGRDPDRVETWLFARCAVEAIDDPALYAVMQLLAP
jgi:streptomycin 6-kinase